MLLEIEKKNCTCGIYSFLSPRTTFGLFNRYRLTCRQISKSQMIISAQIQKKIQQNMSAMWWNNRHVCDLSLTRCPTKTMFRRSRSQSLSTADRNRKVGKNVNNFKRSGSVQDLKVLGGKKDMLNKKKTKLTRQESADIRTYDEGKNLTSFFMASSKMTLPHFCRLFAISSRANKRTSETVHPFVHPRPRRA